MSSVTKLDVNMTCGGCSGVVERLLMQMDGVSKVECNIDENSVAVTADGVSGDEMLEKLAKWSEASGNYVKHAE